MSRIVRFLGTFLLSGALILLIFTSISVPYLSPLNISEVDISSGSLTVCRNDGCDTLVSSVEKVRVGVWGYCAEDSSGEQTCTGADSAYELIFKTSSSSVSIGASWTRGLVIHPIAAALTLVALLFSFASSTFLILLTTLFASVGALASLASFACDIALFVFLRHKINSLEDIEASTNPGIGFWFAFAATIALMVGSCVSCLGRRRARMDGATSGGTYPMSPTKTGFWQRFSRSKASS